MEEERVAMMVAKQGKVTAELILKGLFIGVGKLINGAILGGGILVDNIKNRPFRTEANWQKFINRLDEKVAIKELSSAEVNLEKFKTELKKYGIGFSFKEQPENDTVLLAYSFRHERFVEKALSDTIKDIVKDPKAFMEQVKKRPGDKTLNEKLKYYDLTVQERIAFKKEQMNNKGNLFNQTPTVDIEKVTGGKTR